VAVGIDQARSDAVASYAVAAAHNAAETERVAVAALMHDSVLAALIAAERAHTAGGGAGGRDGARGADAAGQRRPGRGRGPDEPVAVAAIAAALRRVVADLDADAPSPPTSPRPLRSFRGASRAVVLAATQAVSNAIVHAHGEGLRVALRADGQRLRVQVTDRGPGFDPASIPDDRLGIRGSIVARMAAVGGRARVRTAADGTHVVLDWEFSR
jgi:signal transduction histidine kinase